MEDDIHMRALTLIGYNTRTPSPITRAIYGITEDGHSEHISATENEVLTLIQVPNDTKAYINITDTTLGHIPVNYSLIPTNRKAIGLLRIELGNYLGLGNGAHVGILLSKDPIIIGVIHRSREYFNVYKLRYSHENKDSNYLIHTEYRTSGLLPSVKGIRTMVNTVYHSKLHPYIRSIMEPMELTTDNTQTTELIAIPSLEQLGGEYDNE